MPGVGHERLGRGLPVLIGVLDRRPHEPFHLIGEAGVELDIPQSVVLPEPLVVTAHVLAVAAGVVLRVADVRGRQPRILTEPEGHPQQVLADVLHLVAADAADLLDLLSNLLPGAGPRVVHIDLKLPFAADPDPATAFVGLEDEDAGDLVPAGEGQCPVHTVGAEGFLIRDLINREALPLDGGYGLRRLLPLLRHLADRERGVGDVPKLVALGVEHLPGLLLGFLVWLPGTEGFVIRLSELQLLLGEFNPIPNVPVRHLQSLVHLVDDRAAGPDVLPTGGVHGELPLGARGVLLPLRGVLLGFGDCPFEVRRRLGVRPALGAVVLEGGFEPRDHVAKVGVRPVDDAVLLGPPRPTFERQPLGGNGLVVKKGLVGVEHRRVEGFDPHPRRLH